MPRLRKKRRASLDNLGIKKKSDGTAESTTAEFVESATAESATVESSDSTTKPLKRRVSPVPTNLLKAGYSLVKKSNRDYWKSPGGRVYIPNSDRLAKSIVENNVKGSVPKARRKLTWTGIGLSPKKKVRKVSKHATRTWSLVDKNDQSLHITSLEHFRVFMSNLAQTNKCTNINNGKMCGGSYQVNQQIKRGVGGAFIAIIKCNSCGHEVPYGSQTYYADKTNMVKSAGIKLIEGTRNSIGRSMMFAFMAAGRPMYYQYAKMFGFSGIDHYCQRTFQRAVEEAARAFEKREEVEVKMIYILS